MLYHQPLLCMQIHSTLIALLLICTGGYAGLQRVMQWNLDFMSKSDAGEEYLELAKRVDEAIQFMVACGLDYNTAIMNETEFYVSHECLLMEYERALTRQDSTTGLWCGCLTALSILHAELPIQSIARHETTTSAVTSVLLPQDGSALLQDLAALCLHLHADPLCTSVPAYSAATLPELLCILCPHLRQALPIQTVHMVWHQLVPQSRCTHVDGALIS